MELQVRIMGTQRKDNTIDEPFLTCLIPIHIPFYVKCFNMTTGLWP